LPIFVVLADNYQAGLLTPEITVILFVRGTCLFLLS